MGTLTSLFNEASNVDSKSFMKAVNQVVQILSVEKSNARMRITGRLIHLSPEGEAIVIGDLHGDINSLNEILNKTNFHEKSKNGMQVYLVFLGDYGDRGPFSPEVYYVVLSLKMMFPENVILLQGNHEGPQDLLADPHDLPFHLQRKFDSDWQVVYTELSALFRRFYTAVLVEDNFVMLHGGVPSKVKTLDDVAYAYQKHPAETHLEEILWSDPAEGIIGTLFSPRGAGRLFGENVTDAFLKMVKAEFLVRGHEPVDEGYKFNHNSKILTIFSRKGPPYNNSRGAYLIVDMSKKTDSASKLNSCIQQF
jgi:diadenosine tetraphosphatase ApaH/serine/threonine PP2A family protein phosphatase